MATEHLNSDIDVGNDEMKRIVLDDFSQFEKLDEFRLDSSSRKYDEQFFSMYQYRLSTLKKRVEENALAKWGDGQKKVDGQVVVRKEKILDITSGQICWVSGTVYSDLKNKLDILKDVENGKDNVLPKEPDTYTEKGEEVPVVMLEDESGRAVLDNAEFLKKNILVTGCIVAVLGIEVQAGIFEIIDVVYPRISPQKPLKEVSTTTTATPTQGSKVAIISGLELKNNANSELSIELLKQYLSGELGLNQDKQFVSQIGHLIVAGNSVAPNDDVEDDDFFTTNNYGSKNTSRFGQEALHNFDQFVHSLLPTIPISVMPGQNDPAEICLPQQPLHRSIFHSSKQYVGGPNLHNLTNPCWLQLGPRQVRLLGTAGQNVLDILKYVSPEVAATPGIELDIMEANMKWQNFVPTAPDTLYCYPFTDLDPFTLATETPHVYFVGNQRSYHQKTIYLQLALDKKDSKGAKSALVPITLISIPKFCDENQLVILDLNTLECQLVSLALS